MLEREIEEKHRDRGELLEGNSLPASTRMNVNVVALLEKLEKRESVLSLKGAFQKVRGKGSDKQKDILAEYTEKAQTTLGVQIRNWSPDKQK